MPCSICGRENVWHGSELGPRPGTYLSEMGCHDGVRMDDDEYHEGWQDDVAYPPCPHSPLCCASCKGTGRAGPEVTDSDDCPECQGTGWKNGEVKWPSSIDEADPVAALVDRFLAWPLPPTVCSDLCVTDRDYKFPRSGTNLLNVDEARQMIEYLLAPASADGE